jgi:hypothetical protein
LLLRPSNHGEQVIYQLPLQPARGGPARHIHLLPDRCEGWRVTAGGANDRSVRVEADSEVRDVRPGMSVVATAVR